MKSTLLSFALTLAILPACSSAPDDAEGTNAQAEETAGADGATAVSAAEVKELLSTGLQGLCLYAEMREQRGEAACKDETLVAVCSQMTNSLDEGVASLIAHPTGAGLATKDTDKKELAASMKADFEGALDVCFNGQAARMKALEEKMKNDPHLIALAAAGRDRYWHMTMRGIGRALRDVATVEKGQVRGSLTRMLKRGVCTVGARFAADMVRVSGPEAERTAACIATAGDACSAAAGFINLNDWPGLDTDDEVGKYLEDIASVGLEMLCQGGGRVSAVACGTISVAMGQIKKAINTGTNDWYVCSGLGAYLDPIAEDVGWYIGADGWTSNMPIAQPRLMPGPGDEQYTVRACCVCDKVMSIREHGYIWNSDKDYYRSKDVSVIQAGGYEGGNCAYKNGREYSEGYVGASDNGFERLHRYEQCHQSYVMGESCSLLRGEARKPNPLTVWDIDRRRATGEVLRPRND